MNFAKANVSSAITQLEGDVRALLGDVPDSVDFIFLDADRETYMALAEPLFRLLKPGGLLVCDNATSHRHELEAFSNWLSQQSYLTTLLVPIGKGELLVYKGKE